MDGLPAEKSGLVVFTTGRKDDADNFLSELRAAIVNAYGL
jgi:hypothetical protein